MKCAASLGTFLLFLLTRAHAPVECPPQYNVTLATSEGSNVVAVRRETSVVDNGNLININVNLCIDTLVIFIDNIYYMFIM